MRELTGIILIHPLKMSFFFFKDFGAGKSLTLFFITPYHLPLALGRGRKSRQPLLCFYQVLQAEWVLLLPYMHVIEPDLKYLKLLDGLDLIILRSRLTNVLIDSYQLVSMLVISWRLVRNSITAIHKDWYFWNKINFPILPVMLVEVN